MYGYGYRYGMGFGVRRASGAWSPVALFANAEKGGYFDPYRPNSIFQDTDGLVPVSASGQSVQRADIVYPGGGAGGNLLQSTAGKYPTYIESGAKKLLRGDGAADSMSAAGFDLAGCSKVTLIIGITHGAYTGLDMIMEHGTNIGAGTGGIAAVVNNGASGAFGGGIGNGVSNTRSNNAFSAGVPRSYLGTIIFSPEATTDDEKVRIRIDGEEIDESLAAGPGTVSAAAFAVRTLYLFARNNTANFFLGDIARWILIGRELDADELAAAELWAQKGLDPDNPYPKRPTQFTDSETPVDNSIYLRTSAFASADYQTTATEIEVTAIASLYASHADLTALGVYVNGEYHSSIEFASNGIENHLVSLPLGSKVLSIVNGPQAKPAATILNCSLLKLRANAPLTQVNLTAPSDRLLIYGDSIAVGDAATVVMAEAWSLLVRVGRYPASTALEAWGSRSLYDDAVDGTARAAFVAKMVTAFSGVTDQKMWLAIGTNDYALNKWSAASFGTAYAALLDDLHTALPDLEIFAQSPLVRSTETANGSGSTLGDYRSQIETACSSRAWATYVDGSAILTTGDLDDGVHPTTAGHALYAAAVLAEITP